MLQEDAQEVINHFTWRGNGPEAIKKRGAGSFHLAFSTSGKLNAKPGKERPHVSLLFLPESGYKGFCAYAPR